MFEKQLLEAPLWFHEQLRDRNPQRFGNCVKCLEPWRLLSLLHFLGRTPFVDSAELAFILGEPHTTAHRALTDLLAHGIAERASHGTIHLPSSQRYRLTASGVREAAGLLGFDTPQTT